MERFAPGRVAGGKEARHGKRHDEKDKAKTAKKTKKAEYPYNSAFHSG
jgi:hypothetical protein